MEHYIGVVDSPAEMVVKKMYIGKVEQHTSFERVIATKLSFVERAKTSHPPFLDDYHDLSLS